MTSFLSTLKDLSFDLTSIGLKFVANTYKQTIKPNFNYISNEVADILNEIKSTNEISYTDSGPRNEVLDLSTVQILNKDDTKILHTIELIKSFNERNAQREKSRKNLNLDKSNSSFHFDQLNNKTFEYKVTPHKVATKDGFVLTLFRIGYVEKQTENNDLIKSFIDDYQNEISLSKQRRKSMIDFPNLNSISEKINNDNKDIIKMPSILIQHGVLDSSDGSLINQEEKCIPLVLAKKGYDVWLGNTRGNYYSEEHLSLNMIEDAEAYWNFSFDEMGRYDIPAMIQKIQQVNNNNDKIIVMAHSQGATAVIAGMSLNPEFYSKTVSKYIALSPCAKLTNIKSRILKYALHSKVEKVFSTLNKHSLAHRCKTLSFLSSKHLNNLKIKAGNNNSLDNITSSSQKESFSKNVSSKIKSFFNFTNKINFELDIPSFVISFLTDKKSCEINDPTALNKYISFNPSGISVKSLLHFKGNYMSDTFSHYDYGKEKNSKIYKSNIPPQYPLEKISVPTFIIYGEHDQLTNEVDLDYFHSKMLNSIVEIKKYESLGHLSYFVAKDFSWFNDVFNFIQN